MAGLTANSKKCWHTVQQTVAVVETAANKAWTAVLAAAVVIDW